MMVRVDVGLMILDNVPAFYRGTSPNKFFDYIASGTPVLNNYPGWLAELIREHRIGWVVPPGKSTEFADQIYSVSSTSISQQSSRNARCLAESDFARHNLSRHFLAALLPAVVED